MNFFQPSALDKKFAPAVFPEVQRCNVKRYISHYTIKARQKMLQETVRLKRINAA